MNVSDIFEVLLLVSHVCLVVTQESVYGNQFSIVGSIQINFFLIFYAFLSFKINLTRNQGYTVEIHANIQTEDGYLLDMHRIPFGKTANDIKTPRPPVLVLHGFSQTSEIFVSTKNGLGFVLADMGFDVWLGNCRGNKYSRKHVRLDPIYDRAYSNYSYVFDSLKKKNK